MMPATCVICLDETDSNGVDSNACSNGHFMHDGCFEQYMLSQTDNLSQTDSLTLRANSTTSGSDRAFLEGRICCPSFACNSEISNDGNI